MTHLNVAWFPLRTQNSLTLSLVRLFAILQAVAHQAPLSMGFSRKEYWSGLPCRPPENLAHPGVEPRSPTLQADALTSEPPGKTKMLIMTDNSFRLI